jgi:hypothetical protein
LLGPTRNPTGRQSRLMSDNLVTRMIVVDIDARLFIMSR